MHQNNAVCCLFSQLTRARSSCGILTILWPIPSPCWYFCNLAKDSLFCHEVVVINVFKPLRLWLNFKLGFSIWPHPVWMLEKYFKYLLVEIASFDKICKENSVFLKDCAWNNSSVCKRSHACAMEQLLWTFSDIFYTLAMNAVVSKFLFPCYANMIL